MCSRKCARPGKFDGSLLVPTKTSIEAAAVSVVGSEISNTFRVLGSVRNRYLRSLSPGASMDAWIEVVIQIRTTANRRMSPPIFIPIFGICPEFRVVPNACVVIGGERIVKTQESIPFFPTFFTTLKCERVQ